MKVKISDRELAEIRDLAMSAFRERMYYGMGGAEDVQILLIIDALHAFLRSKGIEPDFEVEIKR